MDSNVDDWNGEVGTRAKRQRESKEESTADSDGGRDYYYEILQGRFTGIVRNSWLKYTRQISSLDVPHMHFDRPTDIRLSIKPFSQQLLQAKRKLWPAAEHCARVTDSCSSPQREFAKARRWCNPMEPLGEGKARGLNNMFMNRSAIKLANIDAMLEFSLTPDNAEDPFLFVDLCGAPGGFSEYIMMRVQSAHSWSTQDTVFGSCRGYGMSLIGSNEHGIGTPWKLNHISQSNSNGTFQTEYRVCKGIDGKGDIYSWENIQSLGREIQADLQESGLNAIDKVHLVVADGGFDAQRDSECQEALAQKLVLCEMAAGLHLLAVGGTMVLKMFGSQTSTMRTAMQSMFDMFEQIQSLKPISSRPASSERYVVFSGFRGVQNHWDGRSWMNSVFLGKATLSSPGSYDSLNAYLDEVDMDMLALNLKACFAILSALGRKSAAMNDDEMSEDDSWEEERSPVNIHAYKTAWRLH